MSTASGTITDSSGQPVSGSFQICRSANCTGELAVGNTDANGNYSATVSPGSYYFRIVTGASDLVSQSAMDLSANVVQNFVLPTAHTLSVTVLDPSGLPVSNAFVTAQGGTCDCGNSGYAFVDGGSDNNGVTGPDGVTSISRFPTTDDVTGNVTPSPVSFLNSASFDVGTLEQDESVIVHMQSGALTFTSAAVEHINARDPVNFAVTTTGNPTPSLTESGALPTGLTFTDNGDGTASITGQASTVNNGLYLIVITASSSVGTATQDLYLSVDNVQEAPTIISANTLTETKGTPFSFTVDTTGDPIPSISKVSGSGALPAGVTLKNNSDGTASLSGSLNGASDSGVYTFTIKAHNANGDATQAFTLYVNSAPAITSKTSATATTVADMTPFAITTSGYPNAALTETGSLPSGVTFVDNGDGTATISGTPGTGVGGVYTLTINATNGIGAPATQAFTITVNQAPAISSAASATVTHGTASAFQVTASGFPAPTYSLLGTLPTGVSIVHGTGVLKTTASTPAGIYTFTVTAANSTATTTQTFALTVR